jgi:antitoxin CcdA
MATNLLLKTRRGTNVSLDADILEDAKALGINVSRACEKGLVAEIAKTRGEKWLQNNMDAIESSNAWVQKRGLPLAKHRMF